MQDVSKGKYPPSYCIKTPVMYSEPFGKTFPNPYTLYVPFFNTLFGICDFQLKHFLEGYRDTTCLYLFFIYILAFLYIINKCKYFLLSKCLHLPQYVGNLFEQQFFEQVSGWQHSYIHTYNYAKLYVYIIFLTSADIFLAQLKLLLSNISLLRNSCISKIYNIEIQKKKKENLTCVDTLLKMYSVLILFFQTILLQMFIFQ
eukprot:TRINITY_DN30377_c0_g1_i1.p1 TRINITY_DN30377_c0_g1~~TRINITY_DN30377_c0_g1_i1.p1  ORF type:complete len:201 (-),score=-14.59 TRINITY_DN30377_c0_g1_i1:733-1335(-)